MNSIELAKNYVPILDQVYASASVTAKLDGAPELAKAGANANELIIPIMDMQGLGEYTDKYPDGDVTLRNESVKCNYNRGRMFSVDNMENLETANIAFGRLAGEFVRTKVVSELDAFRFATYAAKAGQKVSAALASGKEVISALRAAMNYMDEKEVSLEERHLYITPTLLGLVEDMNTTESRKIIDTFASVSKVPQSRFYSAIEMLDGKTAGEEAGSFKKAAGALDINFEIIHKPAVIQYSKHVKPKIVDPDTNQDADAYKFGYRHVAIADVYQNKVNGIYAHQKPAT